jgi:excisionase family DNA binding protein
MKTAIDPIISEERCNNEAVWLFAECPEVMNIMQVSQVLGVCPNTVRAMIYQHQIPAKKIGSKWHVLRSDLRAWVTTADN